MQRRLSCNYHAANTCEDSISYDEESLNLRYTKTGLSLKIEETVLSLRSTRLSPVLTETRTELFGLPAFTGSAVSTAGLSGDRAGCKPLIGSRVEMFWTVRGIFAINAANLKSPLCRKSKTTCVLISPFLQPSAQRRGERR